MTSEDNQWLSSLGRNALIECNLLRKDGDDWLARRRKLDDRLELFMFVARARHQDDACAAVSALLDEVRSCKDYPELCDRGIPDKVAGLARGEW